MSGLNKTLRTECLFPAVNFLFLLMVNFLRWRLFPASSLRLHYSYVLSVARYAAEAHTLLFGAHTHPVCDPLTPWVLRNHGNTQIRNMGWRENGERGGAYVHPQAHRPRQSFQITVVR